jgi:hypothetical protein
MVAFCIDENRIHSQNKLDMEELRLYAKAFSYLPMSFLQTRNPMVLTKLVKKAADEDCVLTIENYLKSLNLIVTSMKEEDSHTQYRALYAFFNFLMLTQHIIEQQSTFQKVRSFFQRGLQSLNSKEMHLASPLEQMYDSISLPILSVCIKKTSIMASVISLPIKTTNQSLIRLCMKILIEAYSTQAKLLFSNPSD